MIFDLMTRLAPVHLFFTLFLSAHSAWAGLEADGSLNKEEVKSNTCPFPLFISGAESSPETSAQEAKGAVVSVPSEDPLEQWAAKWEKGTQAGNKDGGLSYKYFIGLNQPDRFFIDPKVQSSLKEFSPDEQREWIDQPMHTSEILKWFREFGEALCPKALNEWDAFRIDYSTGTLIQKRIGSLKEEAKTQIQKYPLAAEMLVDYCTEISSFKANPQWQSCTNKMKKLVQMVASAPSPSRMPGVKNLAYASREEQSAYRSLFQLPTVGAKYYSKDEKQNPWLIFVSNLRKNFLDESRLTDEDAANFKDFIETNVKQFRENVLKLDPDALVVYTEAVQIDINIFPLSGRLMVLSVTPSCVNLIQMPMIGRSQLSSAAELKKAIAGNIYRSYFVSLISQCSHDPISGKKLDRPIAFGEAFKAINDTRLDQDLLRSDFSFNSWKSANSSHLCASCHADAFKEPQFSTKGLPFVDADSMAKIKLKTKKLLGESKKLPVWISKWPIEDSSAENLLFDRSMTDGPDLAFKNSAQDNALIEATLDSCIPEDRRDIVEYREYIKNSMRCGKCHYEGGRSQGMRGPLKVRLPGSWGFNRGPFTVDVSALHKELLFSVTVRNPKQPDVLMPPSRRVSKERFTTEGPDLERCLFQAYYGPFLRLEPFAGAHFSADWIHSLSNKPLSNKSVLGEWIGEGKSCSAQE